MRRGLRPETKKLWKEKTVKHYVDLTFETWFKQNLHGLTVRAVVINNIESVGKNIWQKMISGRVEISLIINWKSLK